MKCFKLKNLVFLFIFLLIFYSKASTKNIAVIPFTNVTEEATKNWIGAGFSETLTTKLGKIKSINLVEREQMTNILKELNFQYSGFVDETTTVNTGKIYGVDVMVLGSFQIMGEALRVSARFINVETAKIIDTAEVTGNLQDIFKLQDEIAFSLINSLSLVVDEKEKENIKVNPTQNLQAYEWYNKGYGAQIISDNDKAIEYYTKAIELDKNFAKAYNNRGTIYNDKGLLNEAIADYNKALEIDPEFVDVYYNRGIAYQHKELFDEAIINYNKALELDASGNCGTGVTGAAYNNRGNAYYLKGLLDEAIVNYNKALELNPKLALAYKNRGSIYDDKGLYDQAIEDLTKAIQLNPKNDDAYLNRGVAYKHKELYDEAIKDYTKAIELNPKSFQAYFNRGIAYYLKGMEKETITDWKKAADLGYKDANKYLKEYFNVDY